MKKINLTLGVFAALLFGITSCDKNETSPRVTETAKVLVVHASPNAPAVDLYVDDSKVNSSGLSYPDNTGYLSVNSGTRNVKVKVNPSTASSASVINADLPLAKDVNYSVFAIDSVSSISALV